MRRSRWRCGNRAGRKSRKSFAGGWLPKLTINAAGMRGDLPSEANLYRILSIGGSTTICVYLGDAHAWPYVLQTRLNDALGPEAVWVGNVGRPGHQTVHHVLQVEKLLPQHPEIDAVVLLIGINDLLTYVSRVSYPRHTLNPTPRQQMLMAFSIFPGWDDDTPWYERHFAGRMRSLATWRPIPGTGKLQPMDEKGNFVRTLRAHRTKAGRMRPQLPKLEAGLAEYAEHVSQIVDTAQRQDVRLLLLTQPTLWSDSLSPADRDLLVFGGPPMNALRDGAAYYSAGALAAGMARFNERLIAVCRERGVECLDVASQIPRHRDFFYDDAHFTEQGSARLASLVANYLLEREPLKERSRR